jgi:hypothetical protein
MTGMLHHAGLKTYWFILNELFLIVVLYNIIFMEQFYCFLVLGGFFFFFGINVVLIQGLILTRQAL